MGKIESENRLERQKERADNFFDKTKNSLRWILNGNRSKNFQISTIFTNRPEIAYFTNFGHLFLKESPLLQKIS